MVLSDPQLQKHYERVVSVMTALPVELRPVCALMDAYHWFRLIDGKDSKRTDETLHHLTSVELRPALKLWYKNGKGEMNAAAKEFHDFLEKSIGEPLPIA